MMFILLPVPALYFARKSQGHKRKRFEASCISGISFVPALLKQPQGIETFSAVGKLQPDFDFT
jgi:hypothetical protein